MRKMKNAISMVHHAAVMFRNSNVRNIIGSKTITEGRLKLKYADCKTDCKNAVIIDNLPICF